ncbi:MAG: hypothetical protein KC940_01035, partial [Candidatus Omnitrophica bacterium]|nr:hypothetical protein [Candidatus Omnitrophota bacterium]
MKSSVCLQLSLSLLLISIVALSPSQIQAENSKTLTVLDLRQSLEKDFSGSNAYDAAKAVGALQGIVNREEPRLYVIYLPNRMALERGFAIKQPCQDLFWFDWLREEGRMLAEYNIHETTDVWEAIERFQDDLAGLAVWDEEVPATSNVASTIAGAE